MSEINLDNIRLYANSAGFGNRSQDDYHWGEIRQGSTRRVSNQSLSLDDYLRILDGRVPSLLLARRADNGGELVLLTANAKSAHRVDFSNTPLRTALAWIGPDNKDTETALRALASTILSDESMFLREIDSAVETVTNEEDLGFQVDLTRLDQLLTIAGGLELKDVESQAMKVAPMTEHFKVDLGRELAEYSLPHFPGKDLIVLVSRFQNQRFAEERGVWRMLSEQISAESTSWTQISWQQKAPSQSSKTLAGGKPAARFVEAFAGVAGRVKNALSINSEHGQKIHVDPRPQNDSSESKSKVPPGYGSKLEGDESAFGDAEDALNLDAETYQNASVITSAEMHELTDTECPDPGMENVVLEHPFKIHDVPNDTPVHEEQEATKSDDTHSVESQPVSTNGSRLPTETHAFFSSKVPVILGLLGLIVLFQVVILALLIVVVRSIHPFSHSRIFLKPILQRMG